MSDSKLPANLPTALIIPGRGWTRFTYARDDIELLGVVQIGMQIGALAKMQAGHYAQVNGDFIAPLDSGAIEVALRRAGLPDDSRPAHSGKQPGGPPIVTFKKRRRIETANT